MLAVASGPSAFDRQVTSCMHRTLATAHPETPIAEVARLLEASPALAIVDELENIIGVVSRTDLISLGVSCGRQRGLPITLPARIAADIMTDHVITVPSTATLRAAAQAMAAHAIHRIYVVDRRLLVGMIDAMEITAAVRDAGISSQLSTIMTAPPIMITVKTSLGAAVELLSRVRVSGLVVLDEERPVGTFTHLEALAARDLGRTTPIEEVYEPTVLCLPATAPLHAVAGQLVRSSTQRVIACAEREVVGIATTLDFVRYVAW